MKAINPKSKKLKKDVLMSGTIYMTPDGEVYKLTGGWHKYNFGRIPTDSPLFKQIVSTYGTKRGKSVRATAIKRLMGHGEWVVG